MHQLKPEQERVNGTTTNRLHVSDSQAEGGSAEDCRDAPRAPSAVSLHNSSSPVRNNQPPEPEDI